MLGEEDKNVCVFPFKVCYKVTTIKTDLHWQQNKNTDAVIELRVQK